MQNSKCPFHVKQGLVSTDGKLILSDICGIRSACGQDCSYAPFESRNYKTCPHTHTHPGFIIHSNTFGFIFGRRGLFSPPDRKLVVAAIAAVSSAIGPATLDLRLS